MGGRNNSGGPRRPFISAPIGPVRSSRGPDLQRSGTLVIVDTIKDCETNSVDSVQEKSLVVGIQQTRRFSARLNSQGQLASSPTVASVVVTATPTIETPLSPNPPKRPRRSLLSTSVLPRPRFKTASNKDLLPESRMLYQDENVLPKSLDKRGCPTPPASRQTSRLPKSRTMTALHELRTSISRSALAVRSANAASFAGSSPKTSLSSSRTIVDPSNIPKIPPPRASPASTTTKSMRSFTPESQPIHVTTAQSSAYWSGRFVALHDRFSLENLAVERINSSGVTQYSSTLQPDGNAENLYTKYYQRSAHLPPSTTTSALRSLTNNSTASSTGDDDARCNRIFQYLDSLCTTSEARRSLHLWQQAYARRHSRPCLLPEGGSMEDKGFIAKIFGAASSRKGERHSFGAFRQTSANHTTKSRGFLSGSLTGASKGKRLTLA